MSYDDDTIENIYTRKSSSRNSKPSFDVLIDNHKHRNSLNKNSDMTLKSLYKNSPNSEVAPDVESCSVSSNDIGATTDIVLKNKFKRRRVYKRKEVLPISNAEAENFVECASDLPDIISAHPISICTEENAIDDSIISHDSPKTKLNNVDSNDSSLTKIAKVEKRVRRSKKNFSEALGSLSPIDEGNTKKRFKMTKNDNNQSDTNHPSIDKFNDALQKQPSIDPDMGFEIFFEEAEQLAKAKSPNAQPAEIRRMVFGWWREMALTDRTEYNEKALVSRSISSKVNLSHKDDSMKKKKVRRKASNDDNKFQKVRPTTSSPHHQTIATPMVADVASVNASTEASLVRPQCVNHSCCHQEAVECSEWTGHYCSSSCCLQHCVRTLDDWLEKRRQARRPKLQLTIPGLASLQRSGMLPKSAASLMAVASSLQLEDLEIDMDEDLFENDELVLL